MAKHRTPVVTPACYAMTLPGLEAVAAAEIETRGGEIKRSSGGLVVFRVEEVEGTLLGLRTVEDVFLLAWGTDKLTYRAEDLEQIERWTARDVDWSRLLQIHHAIRPKPKGKPTYRLIAQKQGEHGYRRIDARQAMAAGLAGKLPASWKHAEENASVEIWLTIDGQHAICGMRLSDATMRHRTYKREHMPASLRPTLAGAMVRLAEARPGQAVLDPMCGAGTILAEQLEVVRVHALGGDLELNALRAAVANLRHLGYNAGHVNLARWDATRLPLPGDSVDRVISNPPFGKQLSRPEDIPWLYRSMLAEYNRVLRPGGLAVLLVADAAPLRDAARLVSWKSKQELRVRVLGQPANLSVWSKPGARSSVEPVSNRLEV